MKHWYVHCELEPREPHDKVQLVGLSAGTSEVGKGSRISNAVPAATRLSVPQGFKRVPASCNPQGERYEDHLNVCSYI